MARPSRVIRPLAAAVLALGVAAAGLATPQPALASDGYVETAVTTYTVDQVHDRIDVAIDIDFKNATPPMGSTEFYYLGVYVWIEHGATHVGATANHRQVLVERDKRGAAFDRYLVRFGTALFYGQTRRVHVTYQLSSGAPRSRSDIRVGEAIASFCVVGQGDDGGTTKVVIPSDYDVTITAGEGGELEAPSGTSGTAGRTVTYTTGRLEDPFDFWACLSGTNEAGFMTTPFTSPSGRSIELQAWPEDPAWNAEVKSEIGDILTDLEALVGRGLPGHGPIVVREVASGELGPYAGFFSPVSGVARIGEDLGQGDVLAHELSHAWFNDLTFFDRWASEGFAEWARVSTIADTCPEPGAYPGSGAPHLATWEFAGPRSTETDLAVVQYEYDAACYLVTTVATRMGTERMRSVLTALFDHELAYRSGGSVLTRPAIQATWRQWLDAVDELGLVPAGEPDLDFAQELLARYGIATDAVALANRSAARAGYHRLVADLGEWTMPEAILRPMSEWAFDRATTGMEKARAILASVVHADATLPGIDAAHGPARDLFEAARSLDDLAAAATRAADQAAAADAVGAAAARIAAPRDALVELGLLGSDLASPLAAATTAAKQADLPGAQAGAASIDAILDGASQQGVLRLAIGGAVLLLVLALLAFLVLRRRRRPPDGLR